MDNINMMINKDKEQIHKEDMKQMQSLVSQQEVQYELLPINKEENEQFENNPVIKLKRSKSMHDTEIPVYKELLVNGKGNEQEKVSDSWKKRSQLADQRINAFTMEKKVEIKDKVKNNQNDEYKNQNINNENMNHEQVSSLRSNVQQSLSGLFDKVEELNRNDGEDTDMYINMKATLNRLRIISKISRSENTDYYLNAFNMAYDAIWMYTKMNNGVRKYVVSSKSQSLVRQIMEDMEVKKEEFKRVLLEWDTRKYGDYEKDEKIMDKINSTAKNVFGDESKPQIITEKSVDKILENGNVTEKARIAMNLVAKKNMADKHTEQLKERGLFFDADMYERLNNRVIEDIATSPVEQQSEFIEVMLQIHIALIEKLRNEINSNINSAPKGVDKEWYAVVKMRNSAFVNQYNAFIKLEQLFSSKTNVVGYDTILAEKMISNMKKLSDKKKIEEWLSRIIITNDDNIIKEIGKEEQAMSNYSMITAKAKQDELKELIKSGLVKESMYALRNVVKKFDVYPDSKDDSDSYRTMKNSIEEFMKLDHVGIADSRKYQQLFLKARKDVNSYLDSHQGKRFSQKGEYRKSNALQFLNELNKIESKQYERILKHKGKEISNYGSSEEIQEYTVDVRTRIDMVKKGHISLEDVTKILEQGTVVEKVALMYELLRKQEIINKYGNSLEADGYDVDDEIIANMINQVSENFEKMSQIEMLELLDVLIHMHIGKTNEILNEYNDLQRKAPDGVNKQMHAVMQIKYSKLFLEKRAIEQLAYNISSTKIGSAIMNGYSMLNSKFLSGENNNIVDINTKIFGISDAEIASYMDDKAQYIDMVRQHQQKEYNEEKDNLMLNKKEGNKNLSSRKIQEMEVFKLISEAEFEKQVRKKGNINLLRQEQEKVITQSFAKKFTKGYIDDVVKSANSKEMVITLYCLCYLEKLYENNMGLAAYNKIMIDKGMVNEYLDKLINAVDSMDAESQAEIVQEMTLLEISTNKLLIDKYIDFSKQIGETDNKPEKIAQMMREEDVFNKKEGLNYMKQIVGERMSHIVEAQDNNMRRYKKKQQSNKILRLIDELEPKYKIFNFIRLYNKDFLADNVHNSELLKACGLCCENTFYVEKTYVNLCMKFNELPIEKNIIKAMNRFLQNVKTDEGKLDENEEMLDKALKLINKYAALENVTEEQRILALELIHKMTELSQQTSKLVGAFYAE